MRGLSRVMSCLLAAGLSTTAFAQTNVVIDGDQIIPSTDITSISIDPANSDISITTSVGYTVSPVCTQNCGGGDPDPDPDPQGFVTMGPLTATPTTVELGQKVVFGWDTKGAVSCDTKLGNQAWQAHAPLPYDSGSVSIVMDTLGTTKYRLNCTGADDVTRIRGVDVTVVAASNPTNENCPTPDLNAATETLWFNFWGSTFPNEGLDNEKNIDVGGKFVYKAMGFKTGDYTGDGSLVTISNTITPGAVRRVSIAECPGVFVDAPDNCYKVWGNGQVLSWTTQDTAGKCQLEKDKFYYVNMTFTKEANLNESWCGTSKCIMTLRANHD